MTKGVWAAAAVGGALRAAQALLRWDEVTLAYAAYWAPVEHALTAGGVGAAMATWVGLHPPLHGVLMAVLERIWPAPAAWLAVSALASTAAVLLVGARGGPLAAWVLALSPLQLLYGAEVNNYPLAVAALAALLAAGRARWPLLAAAAAFATWSHVLGGVAAGAVVLGRLRNPERPGERLPLAAAAALSVAPVVVGALRRVQGGGVFIQPEAELGATVALWLQDGGWAAIPLALLAGGGWRGAPGVALLGVAGAWGVALLAGAAAPHQRPYLVLLGPPLALAVGRGAVGWRAGLAAALVVVRVAPSLADAQARVSRVLDRSPRAIDSALERSLPGDVLWLVSPALQQDDDKTDVSAVLWRWSPAQAAPRVTAPPHDPVDWTWGQPRWLGGRAVHTSTELAPGPFDAVVGAAGRRGASVWVIVYDHGPALGLLDRVEYALRAHPAVRVPGPWADAGLGQDGLWVIHGGEAR